MINFLVTDLKENVSCKTTWSVCTDSFLVEYRYPTMLVRLLSSTSLIINRQTICRWKSLEFQVPGKLDGAI